MSEDKALNEFLQAFDARMRKEQKFAQLETQQIERKRKALAPLRKLLQRFVDMGLVVHDSRIGEAGIAANATQKFYFYEGESSPSWAPGVSLFFDHPAQVEIALVNDGDVPKFGLVVMRSVTTHRDRIMLHQKFEDMNAAKAALAKFLGRTAVSIEKDPRHALPERTLTIQKNAASALAASPKEPPSEIG